MGEKKEIHLGGTKIVFTDEALYFFDETGYGDSGNMPLDDIVSVLVKKPEFKSGKGSGEGMFIFGLLLVFFGGIMSIIGATCVAVDEDLVFSLAVGLIGLILGVILLVLANKKKVPSLVIRSRSTNGDRVFYVERKNNQSLFEAQSIIRELLQNKVMRNINKQ